MASVLLFARTWTANPMTSNVPNGLGSEAIASVYDVGIRPG